MLQIPVTKHYTRKQWAAVRDSVMQMGHDPESLEVAVARSSRPIMSAAPQPDAGQNKLNQNVASELTDLRERCQALENEVQLLRGQRAPMEQKQTTMEERIQQLENVVKGLSEQFQQEQGRTNEMVNGLDNCLQKWKDESNTGSANNHMPVQNFSAVGLQKFSTILQVYVVLVVMVITVGSVPLTFYDCGSSCSSYPLIVPKNIHCQLREPGSVYKTSIDVYTVRDEPLHLPAYHCHIRERQICTYYLLAFGKGITKDETTIHPVLPLTCKNAVKHHTWQNQTLHVIQDDVWATQNHLKITYSYCCYDY